jgi:hypothetical protein
MSTLREELEENVTVILEDFQGDLPRLAKTLVDEWYDGRNEWLDQLVKRAEGDIDLLKFLAEKYPDGDED